jgi:hypothetical protein
VSPVVDAASAGSVSVAAASELGSVCAMGCSSVAFVDSTLVSVSLDDPAADALAVYSAAVLIFRIINDTGRGFDRFSALGPAALKAAAGFA